ncbi:hypothetical protein TK90_0325 [Thioalkalivibrio sp. K90mix]|jgi:DNA replicative helicase MCM subunit Mcm2 (Cdc46/Mcm family)|uniref:hypothetical protein n=1 Tax=unclassified Thioalkalivibrio TaxID=2621013 RepID=UPI000195A95B|nr:MULTISPECIES: hypothetical protein [unclassified Thioalkalivibrio]ADC70840.1 hypothetical protein TK90_0325 [Thioalkalivibrio sp. K90mix]
MSLDSKKASELSAEELYALARQREKEEAERQEAERRKKREKLMEKRKEMIARHRKELNELERQIRELGGRVGRAGGGRRSGRGGSSVSQQLVEIVAEKSEMATKEIKERAEKAGLDTKNISQTLAYLKRQGRLKSPRRGVYKSAA